MRERQSRCASVGSFGGSSPSSAAAKAVGVALIARCGAIDAAELFDAGKHVHEGLARPRNVEERVALRGHLAEPAADEQDEVGGLHAREQFRIRSDAEIAGVAGMHGSNRCARRNVVATGSAKRSREARERGAGGCPTSGCRPAA